MIKEQLIAAIQRHKNENDTVKIATNEYLLTGDLA